MGCNVITILGLVKQEGRGSEDRGSGEDLGVRVKAMQRVEIPEKRSANQVLLFIQNHR